MQQLMVVKQVLGTRTSGVCYWIGAGISLSSQFIDELNQNTLCTAIRGKLNADLWLPNACVMHVCTWTHMGVCVHACTQTYTQTKRYMSTGPHTKSDTRRRFNIMLNLKQRISLLWLLPLSSVKWLWDRTYPMKLLSIIHTTEPYKCLKRTNLRIWRHSVWINYDGIWQ